MALSTEELKQRLAKQQWTGHNIRLNSEVTTWPNHYDFALDGRLKAIERMLRLTFGEKPNRLRIADLGSLEGGFAVALAQQGAEAWFGSAPIEL